MARRKVERVLNTHGKGPRIAAIAVLALGLVLLFVVVSPSERKRRSVMDDVAIGSDTTVVIRALGQPVRCSPQAPEYIRSGFPGDWPPPAVESALERLSEATMQRWVYAINLRERLPCDSVEGHTEVGVGRDGRVLWYISVTGRTTIQLPDEYSPSGDAS